MLEIILGLLIFSFGFFAGVCWKTMTYDRMPWEIFRWHQDSLGYRMVVPGTVLMKDEKIVMGVSLDTSGMPEEGVEYPVDIEER